MDTVRTIKNNYPHLQVLARATDRVHAFELMELGADCIQRETLDSALVMGEEALRLMGYRAHLAYRLARRFKRHDEEVLRATAKLWGDEKAFIMESRKQMEELQKVLNTDQAQAEPGSDRAWDVSDIRKNAKDGKF